MEKKPASEIMLALMLIGTLTLAFNIQPAKAEPRTWIVDDDGPADFQTIQEAIDAANSGDTIFVKAGTYYELVTINRNSLTLIGESKSTTIIDGSRLNSVVRIMANDVCIKGFTIRNGGADYYGITLSNSMNNTISDNLISDNYQGIGLFYSPNNNIIGNLITTTSFSWTGVFLEASDNNTVSENRIERSNTGIYFFGVDNNVIKNNILISNSQYGLLLAYGSRNNTVCGNIIRESQNGIYFHQVFLANAIPNVFSNNEITNNDCGIYSFWSQNNVFFHNNITDNLRQVFMEQPFNNVWDDGYPSGGNYWSDYNGVDEKSGMNQDQSGWDGLGDTPYVIDADNQDRYPLINPWIERKAGVKAGDWAEYEYIFATSTSTYPPELMNVTVQNIVGTNITFQLVRHYQTPTEETVTGWMDVSTSDARGQGGLPLFISANLTAGGTLYQTIFPVPIEETILREYVGATRETNYFSFEWSFNYIAPDKYFNGSLSAYWDRATGILTEYALENVFVDETLNYVVTTSISFQIVDTNLWKAPSPTEATQELIETIGTWNLPKGTENSLTSKLEDALHLLAIGNENGATHKLMELMSQAEALRAKKLSNEQANYLISEAQRIIDLING